MHDVQAKQDRNYPSSTKYPDFAPVLDRWAALMGPDGPETNSDTVQFIV
jgi:hypothetical protein